MENSYRCSVSHERNARKKHFSSFFAFSFQFKSSNGAPITVGRGCRTRFTGNLNGCLNQICAAIRWTRSKHVKILSHIFPSLPSNSNLNRYSTNISLELVVIPSILMRRRTRRRTNKKSSHTHHIRHPITLFVKHLFIEQVLDTFVHSPEFELNY